MSKDIRRSYQRLSVQGERLSMHRRLRVLAICVAFGLIVAASPPAKAQTLSVLYSFCAQTNCTDGENPNGALVQGTDGNFYGTTTGGGANHNSGTFFKITPSGTLTTIYSFCALPNCADGAFPYGAVVQGTDGNFYGTTTGGGANPGLYGGSAGTVFKITPGGTLTTLYSFCTQGGCTDGCYPWGGVVRGSDGNFYGTTQRGGTDSLAGTVFQITPGGVLTTLHNFDFSDGATPQAGLVLGTDGNFYGMAPFGGHGANDGFGTAFQITTSGTFTVLYYFCSQGGSNCTDGSNPKGGLVQGSDGNFYGTTEVGGAYNQNGTVFKITSGGTLTTLYSFCAEGGNCTDGSEPWAGLIQASDGNFYGTTQYGGNSLGWGTVFKITSSGTLTTLAIFGTNSTDPENPTGVLVQGSDGNIYGTSPFGGGSDDGTVFKLVPAGPAVTFSSSPLAFGSVAENSSSTLDLTISNTGTTGLRITNFYFSSGSPPFTFGSSGTCNLDGQSITAGNSCTVAITFSPTTTGAFTGTFSITDNASGSPQSVSLTGTGTPVIPVVGSLPGTLTFSGQLVGTTSASQAVTLSNTGTAALTITSIATTANFGQSNNCNDSVVAGGSCTINVTFTPTATGALTGSLTITDNNNGTAGSIQTVNLSGTGTAPVAGVSTPSLTFSGQNVQTTSTPQSVTVSNATGTAPLTLASIALSGANASSFAVASAGTTCSTSSPVAAGGSCTINVTFTPTATGSLSATLTITDNSNGVAGSTQTVSLSGTGTGIATASLSTASLTFANQPISTTSTAQTVTVTNTGTLNLSIATATLGGTNVSAFTKTADPCTGATVTPNGTCTVSVTFTPAATGAASATLTFTDNNNNVVGSTQVVTLSATGVDFGVASPTTAQTVAQGGQAQYAINISSVGGTDSSAVSLACANLPAQATCAFNPATVTPGSGGGSSTLTITTAAPVYARTLPPSTGRPPAALPALLVTLLLPVLAAWCRVRRQAPRWAAATCLLWGALLATSFLAACGAGGYLLPKVGGTAVGSYTVTVTGTVGSTQHSTTVTLNVTAS